MGSREPSPWAAGTRGPRAPPPLSPAPAPAPPPRPPPLLLPQGLSMLPVLAVPQLQLVLHGVDVLLDVVHDLAQGKCAPAQGLDGHTELLYLLGDYVLLLLPRRLKDEQFLLQSVGREWRESNSLTPKAGQGLIRAEGAWARGRCRFGTHRAMGHCFTAVTARLGQQWPGVPGPVWARQQRPVRPCPWKAAREAHFCRVRFSFPNWPETYCRCCYKSSGRATDDLPKPSGGKGTWPCISLLDAPPSQLERLCNLACQASGGQPPAEERRAARWRGRCGVRTEGAALGSTGAAGEVEEGWPGLAGAEATGPGAPAGIEGAGLAGEGPMHSRWRRWRWRRPGSFTQLWPGVLGLLDKNI